jgi:hypothetical protein
MIAIQTDLELLGGAVPDGAESTVSVPGIDTLSPEPRSAYLPTG